MNIYTRNIYIDSICAMNTWIGCANIRDAYISYICAKSAFARSVKPRALAESGIILSYLEINDCCFLLFIELIFDLIEEISC